MCFVVIHGERAHLSPRNLPASGLGESIRYSCFGREVLIDIGNPRAEIWQKHPAVEWDVVLLTHNDGDHIGDASSFFLHSQVREVWLPYDWHLLFQSLEDLAAHGPVDIEVLSSTTLFDEVLSTVREHREALESDAQLGDGRGGAWPVGDRDVPRPRTSLDYLLRVLRATRGALSTWQPSQWDHLELAMSWIGQDSTVARGLTGRRVGPRRLKDRSVPTVTAMDAIYSACWAGRVNAVRWYSVDAASAHPTRAGHSPWELAGDPSLLTVVNAWGVKPPTATPPTSLAAAFGRVVVAYLLTIQNRRALVSMSACSVGTSTCLFSSDSGFEFNRSTVSKVLVDVPWSRVGASVGMHHGSAEADHDHLFAQLQGLDVVFGRSGSNKRLHPAFLAPPDDKRGCTWCKTHGTATGALRTTDRDVVILGPCHRNGHSNWEIVSGQCSGCLVYP